MTTHNTFAATPESKRPFDWTQTISRANKQGREEFQKLIDAGASTEGQHKTDKKDYEARMSRAFDLARRNRCNPEAQFLRGIRNYARAAAQDILVLQAKKEEVRTDFFTHFETKLGEEIDERILTIKMSWRTEDEQRAAKQQEEEEAKQQAKRHEAERAYGDAYPLVEGLHGVILAQSTHLQDAWKANQENERVWAHAYKASVEDREKGLEAREKRLERLEKWGDGASIVRMMVSTGKTTLGLLFLIAFFVLVILGACYFAFPHH